jgi:predicted acetyltransferase
MPSLQAPTARLHTAFREAHQEWGPGLHEDGFGLTADDDVETAGGFAAWVSRLTRAEDPATDPGIGHSHATYRWMVEDSAIQGGIALRHTLSEALGHIGYGVRPSARRRGLGAWALTEMLGEARARGFDRVLLVCATDNVGSARTILRCGGILEPGSGPTDRYWIAL